MEKWEYLFINIKLKGGVWYPETANGESIDSDKPLRIHEYANKLGEEGWELVAAPYTSDSFNTPHPRLIFKRPKV